MKKNYVAPAVKAAKIVINQIVMTSGGSGSDTPEIDPEKPMIPVITDKIEDEGYAE